MPLPQSLEHSAIYLIRRSIELGAQLGAKLPQSCQAPTDFEQRLADWASFNGVTEVLTRVTEDLPTARWVCMNFRSASDTFNVQPPHGAHTHYALSPNTDRLEELRRWFLDFPDVDGSTYYQFAAFAGKERWWSGFLALARNPHTEGAIDEAAQLTDPDMPPTPYTVLARARAYHRLVLPRWAELVRRIEIDPAEVYSGDLPWV
jgi:hypothetical protein